VLVAAVLAGALLLAAPAAAEPVRVVYHLNGPGGAAHADWRAAMLYMRNHVETVGQDAIDLRVVLHDRGVGLLSVAVDHVGVQMDVLDLRARGVSFLVCGITLRGMGISAEDDLFEVWEDEIVPSGVAEIARLQTEGFAYIKP
jgi:intracellular sulfur oxidation DsrE/DsrF family protein